MKRLVMLLAVLVLVAGCGRGRAERDAEAKAEAARQESLELQKKQLEATRLSTRDRALADVAADYRRQLEDQAKIAKDLTDGIVKRIENGSITREQGEADLEKIHAIDDQVRKSLADVAESQRAKARAAAVAK